MFSLKGIMLISILSLVSINIFAEFKDNKVTEEYFGGIWKYDSQNPAAKNLPKTIELAQFIFEPDTKSCNGHSYSMIFSFSNGREIHKDLPKLQKALFKKAENKQLFLKIIEEQTTLFKKDKLTFYPVLMAECDSQKSIILLSSPNKGLVISHDKANIEKDYAIKIFR
ncbi:hypothetical protein [Haemophilus parainfluenzae]|uniref:hypothetical protein n=1 Tax=Haemophilus parainfluenzae TaxID=729 RepID=UPI0018A40335|nr:hypothetical protein [Haemophilus parainfluenzae]QOR07607.1 hypothetical protein INP99_07290 [Haemophilus parainfluenzae]